MYQQNNNMMQMIQQFNRFRQTFQGDPQQEVMKMVNSGQISQQQLNQAQQMATMLAQMLGMK